MIPGMDFGGFGDIAGNLGGEAGPSSSEGGNSTFGAIVSGGSGGFNPFAKSGAQSFASNPINLVIMGGALVGVAWMLKKK